MRKFCYRLPWILCGALFSSQSVADDKRPLFDSHDTLAVTIEAPVDQIDKKRNDDQYVEGKLRYKDSDGQAQEFDIKLQARGKFRRRFDVCRFPPVRINFRKKQVKGTVFGGQDKLKLVTHCQNKSTLYEQYMLKEYLTYRMHNAITDYSFRVRLLRIRWIDSSDPESSLEHYAFLLEDEELLAKRLGLPLANAAFSTPSRLVPHQSALAGVFEYMIANTDFSMIRGPAGDTCCHNIILLKTDTGELPIPYDFDSSGFVNARYALPNEKFRLKSVTTRLYRGRCEHNVVLDEALQHFRDRRNTLMTLINNQEGLKSNTRSRARKFVENFYKLINNPKRVQSQLIKKCV